MEFAIRSLAGSVNTACVTAAVTDLAPNSSNALAPSTKDPAVSTISSIIIQFLPATSPMRFITLATPGSGRFFSMIAIGAPMRSAKSRALVTPPRSGDTTITSSIFFSLIYLAKIDAPNK